MGRRILIVALLMSALVAGSLPDGRVEQAPTPPSFTFARLMYTGGGWRGGSWATDYPKADIQFIYGLQKFSDFSFIDSDHRTVALQDPELFDYPFLYAVEVGYMRLSDADAARLREYLLRGGFLVADDYHGEYEFESFRSEMQKVFPEYVAVDLPPTHPIFHCYYDIDRLFQVPGIHYIRSGRTWEKGGFKPRFMGIHDDGGRLMVMINHNVDLGDAWEWAEVQEYPREFATLAFELGSNYIVYAMTH